MGTMKNPLLARRYAKAFFDATQGKATLAHLAQRFGVPEMQAALDRPHLALKTLYQLLGGEPADPSLRNLCSILVRRKRAGLLPEISETYERIQEESRGIKRVEVTSAVTLDGKAQQQLVGELMRVVPGAKQVLLDQKVDPTLVGGVQIRIGDKLIDGSVESRLQELRSRF